MPADPNEQYKELLLELYKENQAFLNKLILSLSTVAIPLLFKGVLEETSKCISYVFIIALALFIGVILIQLFGLRVAREGCDKSLSSESEDVTEGLKLFKKAKKCDTIRDFMFSVALVSVGIAFIVKALN